MAARPRHAPVSRSVSTNVTARNCIAGMCTSNGAEVQAKSALVRHWWPQWSSFDHIPVVGLRDLVREKPDRRHTDLVSLAAASANPLGPRRIGEPQSCMPGGTDVALSSAQRSLKCHAQTTGDLR